MAQPERTFRIGLCSASVFVNSRNREVGDDNREYRVVNLQRRYKDGDEWKSSTSFSLADLPAAAKVLELAMHYVAEQEASTD